MTLVTPEFVAFAGEGILGGTGSTPAITMPGTPDANGNDLLVAYCPVNNNIAAQVWSSSDGGWTPVPGFSAAGQAFFYRTDGYTGTSVFTRSTTTNAATVSVVRYHNAGSIPISPVQASANPDLTIASVTPTVAGSKLVAIVSRVVTGGMTWTLPASMTEHHDALQDNIAVAVGDETLANTNPTGTRFFDAAFSGATRGVMFIIEPADVEAETQEGMALSWWDGATETSFDLFYYDGATETEHILTEVST